MSEHSAVSSLGACRTPARWRLGEVDTSTDQGRRPTTLNNSGRWYLKAATAGMGLFPAVGPLWGWPTATGRVAPIAWTQTGSHFN